MFCIIGGDKSSCSIIEELIIKSSLMNLKGSFNDADSFKDQFLQTDGKSLVFIDMDTIGFDIFEFLKNSSFQPNIIMISSTDQYALKAFDLNVVDYLTKPVVFPRFYKAIDKAIKYYSVKGVSNKADNQIFIKKGSALVKLKVKDIVYIEALENYVTLCTAGERFLIHFTMKGIENQLPSGLFLRIHRSYIVNKTMIQRIHEDQLDVIVGGQIKSLPIGKSFRNQMLDDINLITK